MNKKLFSKWLLFTFIFLPCLIFAQEIKGKVTDKATSEPILGATVSVKGTTNGTATDIDGNYSISVETFPAVLVFSYLGYERQEITVDSATTLNVEMVEDATALDEVVITGLGTSIKRANSANAISTVSSEQLVGKTAQATLDGALYGKVTGVNITASSGAPGGGFALRLRGISSINGNNQPLYIIDGVYVNNAEIPSGLRFASGANRGNEENSGNRIADLDPNDIENIEVLKGASAAAIYGTRANAGVVIITTKRGKSGKTNIRFSQDLGFNTIINTLGQRQWNAANVESTFGAAEVPLFNQAIANGGLIDYEDEIYGEEGFITETRLSARGGNENTKYYVGTSYRDEDGIIQGTGFERFSIRANLDQKISNTFDLSVSSSYSRTSSNRSFTGNENEGGLSFGYTLSFTRPWINQFPDENGNYPDNPNYTGNPIFVRDNALNTDRNNRFIQGLKLTTKILNTDKHRLKVIFNGGLDYLANETYVYVPETHQAQRGNQNGFIGVGRNNFTNYNFQTIGVWNTSLLNDDLALTTQGGISYLEQQASIIFNQATQLIPNQTTLGQGAAQAIEQTESTVREFGFFAQVEGNYKDQLIGTIGYRRDKSTLNGDPDEYFGFPKASLAVNLHNFDFWDSNAINQLKFRTAYGETGSSAAFGSAFTSLNQVSIGSNGGSSISALRGDANIDPETSQEFEVGIDARLFDRFNVELTYYNRDVNDLILSRTLPTSSGFGTETTNLADLENYGLEAAVRFDAFNNDNFYWNTGIQFWFNRSEVTRLEVPAFPQPGAGFGLGLGTFFIEEGSPVTQLVGNIDGTPTRVGDVEPDFQMSFNNSFTLFKNWDISFLLHWKSGGDNLNLSRLLSDLGGLTPDLDTQAGQDRTALGFVATRFVEPAGYLRLRELATYYRLPESAYSWLGKDISGVKLGLSARNLFTITDYTSYDPETSVNGGSGLSSGIEVTPFPSAKQFYFHLNVNF
ncbi:SusC/RagA family TonB-linked outer membrane protein [Winogradskyella immobilis]|uniref:SusC/RagA family TonB-linked outer membrane protein n=1 Tax=Winogradskyella immobilis TaxID=2816852 RepID=A0ABS8EN57_9FLAO|nr:SusC/RagA family TonB-linked outer membrane protein [Winogradskyella immobilis]MCC1484346.1 SusC/RagA family TonB-linked outer membrane protein [Winogradskyella immobilis]MCG0016438.1 SusC/RagA family TonB-linked outer membrane protein [Winogradskyella immobilis]